MVARRRLANPLVTWAVEREAIRRRKEAGEPRPWTTDPIMSVYRFCNVRRREDRVSQWLLKNVLTEENIKRDLWSFIQFSALCRWINWPPTIAGIINSGYWPKKRIDFKKIGDFVEAQCQSKVKTWTGAYLINMPKGTGLPKGRAIAEFVIGSELKRIKKPLLAALETKKLRTVWEVLQTGECYGSFMSGQICADWSYTSLLKDATDLYKWAPVGPGSLRGYNRLLGFPIKQKAPSEEVWCAQLQVWRRELIEALGPEYEDLELMSVQSCMCETDKMLRVLNGEGRPRSKYQQQQLF